MKTMIFAAILALSLTACGSSNNQAAPQAQIQPQPSSQVVVVQQPVQGSGGYSMGDMMMAGVVGHMLGGGGTRYAPQTTVVNRTVINRTVVQSPARQYVAPRQSFNSQPSFSRRR